MGRKVLVSEEYLLSIAESLRTVNGDTKKYKLSQMGAEVASVMDSNTYLLVDDNGKEVPAVWVESDVVFDATEDDIREGKAAVSEKGFVIGTKVIPGYLAHQGVKIVRPNDRFEIQISQSDQYDYTLLECLICNFNTKLSDSVATDKVVINDVVYNVQSITPLFSVTKNHETQIIDLGFINETDEIQILRYFTYKEIY